MTPEQAERLVEAVERIADSLEVLGLDKATTDDTIKHQGETAVPAWLVYLRNISWGPQ